MREVLLAVLLCLSAGLFALGVFLIWVPAGFMMAGLLVAVLSLAVFTGPERLRQP